ncbi:hypothetical protein DLR11_13030 [Salmonella enterica subsp. salamae]|nr:hypothetical protein [Salmonella enterica subsp. salamae]EAW1761707.1 hypothetical protein [Salmonella enterica subsp. enterica]EBW4675320.1 hypothetical protein [Salmonella enterica subsp. salamae serovar Sofia]ECE5743263.1 hypothetical protein [Salmonella enterica subsp. salamae]ECI3452736.1 hypothetical protein [Salmonella enterica subsp. salamae]
MFAIRPNDFYRCIMSPNMMLARTRPLQFQQGPFFILLLHISVCYCVGFPRAPRSRSYLRSRGFAASPPCRKPNYFGENVPPVKND